MFVFVSLSVLIYWNINMYEVTKYSSDVPATSRRHHQQGMDIDARSTLINLHTWKTYLGKELSTLDCKTKIKISKEIVKAYESVCKFKIRVNCLMYSISFFPLLESSNNCLLLRFFEVRSYYEVASIIDEHIL